MMHCGEDYFCHFTIVVVLTTEADRTDTHGNNIGLLKVRLLWSPHERAAVKVLIRALQFPQEMTSKVFNVIRSYFSEGTSAKCTYCCLCCGVMNEMLVLM